LKERAVLSLLALPAGSAVATGEPIDALWGPSPPPSALRGLHNFVANLRRVLPAGTVVTVPGGYRADPAPEAVDALRFEQAVSDANGAADVANCRERWRRDDLGQCVPWESDEGVKLEREYAGLDGWIAAHDLVDFFWCPVKDVEPYQGRFVG
jgi:hypothetical protein